MVISKPIVLILCWYLFVFVTTEVLSYFHILERQWVLLSFLPFLLLIYNLVNWKRLLVGIIGFKLNLTRIVVGVFLGLTFIQGLFSAPSTTDSMVYHLPRVMYWIQESSVYQDVVRSPHDFKAPFAEYLLLNLYFLTDSDRLLFLSQWIAFVMVVYLSWVIAGQLGVTKKWQDLAALFVASVPVVLMQASSTQVDVVPTLLTLICMYLALVLLKRWTVTCVLLLGFAVGLGMATKATFFVYLIIPFGYLFFRLLKKPKKLFQVVAVSILFVLLINFRFATQNMQLYGSVLGVHILPDGSELVHTNEVIGVEALVSNVFRNVLSQIPVPIFASQVQNSINGLYNLVGWQINNPGVTCCGTQFRVNPILYPQEDIVSNPLQIFLVVLAAVLLAVGKVKRISGASNILLLTILSFVAFSLVLKWQPYHSRLLIPYFVLGTLCSVVLLSGAKFQKLLYILACVSVVLGFLVVVFNVSRPFVSYLPFYSLVRAFAKPHSDIPEAFYIRDRERQYFNASFFWHGPYKNIVKKVPNGSKVAVDLYDDFEYPLWVLLRSEAIKFRILPRVKTSEADVVIKSTDQKAEIVGFKMISCEENMVTDGKLCVYIRN